MTFARFILKVVLSSIIAFPLTTNARRFPIRDHGAYHLEQRQGAPSAFKAETSASGPSSVLTVLTPSPGGTSVLITMQSQEITTYLPQYTLCALSTNVSLGSASTPVAPSGKPTYVNGSVPTMTKRQEPRTSGDCTTYYSSTTTLVCHTVLSGLVNEYTVSQCAQPITFSSEYGYSLVTSKSSSIPEPTEPPSIQTLTTYYVADWQYLTSAGVPREVDVEICSSESSTTSCSTKYESWDTTKVTLTSTSTSTIQFETTISGPSEMIIETFTGTITHLSSHVSISTEMDTLTPTTSTSTTAVPRPMTTKTSTTVRSRIGSTIYVTKTLEEASTLPSSGMPLPITNGTLTWHYSASREPTTTTTIFSTSTIFVGTTTVTAPLAGSDGVSMPTGVPLSS